jgi:tetratricopeptide (TPR) repeat protein
MKRLTLAVAGLGAMISLGFYFNRPKTSALSAAEAVADPAPDQTNEDSQPLNAVAAKAKQFRQNPTDANSPAQAPVAHSATPDVRMVSNQAIETLVSPQASFEEKQAIWKRLKETGNLDQAITELEQRAANDPQRAEYAAALGQAYLKKCAVIEDVREQAILAMKADQLLETALGLNPSNWEARFTKAVGMSYWPVQLNKGQEVIEQFQTLIQQQEAQPPQPQFARPYLWLGDQYQKAGYPDYAAQVWQRGAALFPDNSELRRKLVSAP